MIRLILAIVMTTSTIILAQLPRSRAVIREFARQTGYPNGRPGWVVDHQIPLCAGGPDTIPNLQWQERSESYIKDKFEIELCRDMKRLGLKRMEAE